MVTFNTNKNKENVDIEFLAETLLDTQKALAQFVKAATKRDEEIQSGFMMIKEILAALHERLNDVERKMRKGE